jgi:hypothetical protein
MSTGTGCALIVLGGVAVGALGVALSGTAPMLALPLMALGLYAGNRLHGRISEASRSPRRALRSL